MSKRTIDRELVRRMHEQKCTLHQIAEKCGCSASTIKRIIDERDYEQQTKPHFVKEVDDTIRFPIQPEEVEEYRRNLRIGETVNMEIRSETLDGSRTQISRFTVVAKYPYLFVARDNWGREVHKTYVDMLLKNRAAG